jgi:hypothetical protein
MRADFHTASADFCRRVQLLTPAAAGELPHTFEHNDRSLHFPPRIRHILEKLSESDRAQLFLYVLHGAGLREDA